MGSLRSDFAFNTFSFVGGSNCYGPSSCQDFIGCRNQLEGYDLDSPHGSYRVSTNLVLVTASVDAITFIPVTNLQGVIGFVQ